jgi:hypothetical protein
VRAAHERRVDFAVQTHIVEVAPRTRDEADIFFPPYRLTQSELHRPARISGGSTENMQFVAIFTRFGTRQLRFILSS